jgi:hypothetical protein
MSAAEEKDAARFERNTRSTLACAFVIFFVMACGSTIEARGIKYSVSSSEAETAARIERNADPSLLPPAFKAPCDY